jgi:hypothetical protein
MNNSRAGPICPGFVAHARMPQYILRVDFKLVFAFWRQGPVGLHNNTACGAAPLLVVACRAGPQPGQADCCTGTAAVDGQADCRTGTAAYYTAGVVDGWGDDVAGVSIRNIFLDLEENG